MQQLLVDPEATTTAPKRYDASYDDKNTKILGNTIAAIIVWKRFGVSLFLLSLVLFWVSAYFMTTNKSSSSSTTTETTIDFVTAGVMKSGTSTLLYAFVDHPGVIHLNKEINFVAMPSFLGSWGLRYQVEQVLQQLEHDESSPGDTGLALQNKNNYKKIFGFKSPFVSMNPKSIQRVVQHSPEAKFLLRRICPWSTLELDLQSN